MFGAAEDTRVVISFFILKQRRQANMEDRALRGRQSNWAFVTQATAVVIDNGTLSDSKYILVHPYRVMTSLRDEQ